MFTDLFLVAPKVCNVLSCKLANKLSLYFTIYHWNDGSIGLIVLELSALKVENLVTLVTESKFNGSSPKSNRM